MHNIIPNNKHTIVPVTLAIHANITDPAEISDGINELLRSSIEQDFIADYRFDCNPNKKVESSSAPKEGELFTTSTPINSVLYNQEIEGETKLVFVVGVESLSSGSFDWYENKDIAKAHYQKEKMEVLKYNPTQIHLFSYLVSSALTKNQITDEIDGFYSDESRNTQFNDSDAVKSFPFTADAWDLIVKNHDKQRYGESIDE